VDIKKFTIYNIIGSVAWVSTLTLTGFFLGLKYPGIKDYLQYIIIGLIVITAIPLIVAFARRKGFIDAEENKTNKE
jgi:membrane-associated protein